MKEDEYQRPTSTRWYIGIAKEDQTAKSSDKAKQDTILPLHTSTEEYGSQDLIENRTVSTFGNDLRTVIRQETTSLEEGLFAILSDFNPLDLSGKLQVQA